MMAMVINKDVKNSSGSSQHTTSTSGSRIKAMPPLTLYRPPAARNDTNFQKSSETQAPSISANISVSKQVTPASQRAQLQPQSNVANLTRKLRRPDQQMYVPRARRAEANSQTNNCENTPVKQPFQTQLPAPRNERLSASSVIVKRDSFKKEMPSSKLNKVETISLPKNDTDSPTVIANEMNFSDLSNESSRLSCSLQGSHIEDCLHCTDSSMEELTAPSLSDTCTSERNCCSDVNISRTKGNCDCGTIKKSEPEDKANLIAKNLLNGFTERGYISANEANNHLPNADIDISCSESVSDNFTDENGVLCYSKRKESCENEHLGNVDHRKKQIHLIDTNDGKVSNNADSVFNVSASVINGTNVFGRDENLSEETILNKNKLNIEESDWETLFDDEGNCLEPNILNELSQSVGDVKVHAASGDYRSYQTPEERSNDGECIIEIYGFPSEFKTRDLLNIFAAYRNNTGFQLKWVDDTHALGVFNSPVIADEVLQSELPCVKTRPLKMAIPESKVKARTIPITLPPIARPKTCSVLARRLVSGALGLRIPTDKKKREEEKLMLKEARDKRRLAAKQREAAWEGTIGDIA